MKNTPPALRAVYIVLVPIVLLIILLNSGYLQRWLPAATVHGETYQVVDYNYFYFDCYNRFLEDNESRLEELGYDPDVAANKQNYDADTSWKAYFESLAEASLSETAYYCDLAQAAGYEFSQEELSPVQEQLAENAAYCTAHNLSAKNYYISFYGSGMTEEIYTRHLTDQVKAQAYKAHLIATLEPDPDQLEQALADQPGEEYQSVDLKVITLDALPDRETGQVGQPQLQALEQKLEQLVGRYESGTSFESLQAAFSSLALGDELGNVTHGTSTTLPQVLADWCLTDQDRLAPGDSYSVVDEATGTAYFAVLEGFGPAGQTQDTIEALNQATLDQQEAAAAEADYRVDYSPIGMMLATG